MGGAQTGTGKTAGFGLPLLQRLRRMPTQSLAGAAPGACAHPGADARTGRAGRGEPHAYTASTPACAPPCVFGGVGDRPADSSAARGRRDTRRHARAPARSREQKNITLSQVEIFVLDEADRMLDMGFIPDVKRIISLLPARRQNLLFSATMLG